MQLHLFYCQHQRVTFNECQNVFALQLQRRRRQNLAQKPDREKIKPKPNKRSNKLIYNTLNKFYCITLKGDHKLCQVSNGFHLACEFDFLIKLSHSDLINSPSSSGIFLGAIQANRQFHIILPRTFVMLKPTHINSFCLFFIFFWPRSREILLSTFRNQKTNLLFVCPYN